MLMDFKTLRDLPVETETGLMLGHVHDIIVETNSLVIKQIAVNHHKLIMLDDDILISTEQIISVTEQKIVVADNIKKFLVNDVESQKITNESVATLSAETQN
jgi:uncharacterized protein YrrD